MRELVDQVEIYEYRLYSARPPQFSVTPRCRRRPVMRLCKDVGTLEAARSYAAEFGKPVIENLRN